MMKMMNDCSMPMMMSCNGMPMMCCTCCLRGTSDGLAMAYLGAPSPASRLLRRAIHALD
jgi:hypothetical protein